MPHVNEHASIHSRRALSWQSCQDWHDCGLLVPGHGEQAVRLLDLSDLCSKSVGERHSSVLAWCCGYRANERHPDLHIQACRSGATSAGLRATTVNVTGDNSGRPHVGSFQHCALVLRCLKFALDQCVTRFVSRNG